MKTKINKCILLFFLGFFMIGTSLQAQEDRMIRMSKMLDSLAVSIPGLNENSELNLSGVPLHDYVRTLGKVHRLTLYIDNTPNQLVTISMVNEPVKNILLFICRKFNLTINPVGTILNLEPWMEKPPVIPPPPVKELKVEFQAGKLSFDLNHDSLSAVLRKVSRLTGESIITKPGTDGFLSGYLPFSPLEQSLETILFSNGFTIRKYPKGFFVVEKIGEAGTKPGNKPSSGGPLDYSLQVMEDSLGKLIFLSAENIPLQTLVRDLFEQAKSEYFIFEELSGQTTVRVDGMRLGEILSMAFQGSVYTWRYDDGIYLIGKRDMEGLRQVKVLNLKYRPTEKVIELMPAKLKEGLELKDFAELNKIILSGAPERIREIEAFILEIDKPVPMIRIEMLVVDVNMNRMMKAGIKAGLAQPGDSLSGIKSLLPGFDFNLNGTALNALLGSTGIPMLMNLGPLKSNFYLGLQAEENRGNIRIVTQPIISTLNGSPASLTIGETRFYKLLTNTANNSAVNSFNQVSETLQKIEINTTLNVKPLVSQDGMLTLEVKPTFTSPGAQPDPKTPPDIKQRSFESTIRMRDGETVVLGGLTLESTSSTTQGLPFIARVPILKWFLGTNSREKAKTSLMIYITPTILYN